MKKNIKKIVPIVAIAAIMTTSVFASNMIKGEKPIIEQANVKENQIYIDGKVLENAMLIKENGNVLMPVRAIFEKLGYKIGYDPNTKTVTMEKGPHYITFSNTKDAYTFLRMAPQPLGQAPVVKDGVTYVPVKLFELMGMDIELTSNNVLYIGEKSEEKTENRKHQIIIKEIDEKEQMVLVNDPKLGDVYLNIKGLKIDYKTGDKDLIVGQALEVEYSDMMTKSIPPVNTPKSVKVVDKISYGEILNVEKDEKNNLRVLFNDEEMGDIVLNIAPDFKIEYKGEERELKKGQPLEVVLGKATTLSLPPMNTPDKVVVVKDANKQDQGNIEDDAVKGNAVIKSVDKENNTILITDENVGDVVLNLHDDVKIEHKDGAIKDFEEGQKLEVEYSPIMTRSMPPINNPVKIVVLN